MHELFNYNFKSLDPNEAKISYFIISRVMTYKVVVFCLFKREVRFVKLLQELKYPTDTSLQTRNSHVISGQDSVHFSSNGGSNDQ